MTDQENHKQHTTENKKKNDSARMAFYKQQVISTSYINPCIIKDSKMLVMKLNNYDINIGHVWFNNLNCGDLNLFC